MPFKLIPPTGHKIYFRDFLGKNKSLPFDGYWFNSGTTALYFLIATLDIPDKSNIVIPAYSCPAVAAAVLRAGHYPVLSDINILSFDYDLPELIETIKKTDSQAVIWVNLLGLSASIPSLNVPVILDNAQIAPLRRKIDGITACMYSFGRGKPVNSLGGGIAHIVRQKNFVDPERFYQKIPPVNFIAAFKYLINFIAFRILFHPRLYKIPASLPWLHLGETIFVEDFKVARETGINRNSIRGIFNRMDEIDKLRLNICNYYDTLFSDYADLVQHFPGKTFYRYPVLIKKDGKRDLILKELIAQGIGASGFYPVPLNRQDGLEPILKDNRIYKNAEYVSKHIITFPVNNFVNDHTFITIKNTLDKY